MSSLIADSVADPLATGASLRAVTECDRTTVPLEMVVDPPLIDTSTVAPEVTDPGVSSSRTVSVGAGPLKSVLGKNLSTSVLAKVKAAVSSPSVGAIEELIVVQVAPLSDEYCQSPLDEARV